MEKRLVVIQRNPKSGSGGRSRRREILRLVSSLKERGYCPRLFSRRECLDAFLRENHRRDELVCLVAAGGDGTVGDLINRYPGVPLALFPLGTENLLARYLGITRSGAAAAEMIASGRTRFMDLGLANDRRFSLMMSCGYDAEVIRRLHACRTGHIKKTTYLQPILRSLRTYEYPELRVICDNDGKSISGRLALVANLPMYAMHLRVATSAAGDDGELDLRLFERGSAFQMLRYIYKVAFRKHEQLEDVQSKRVGRIRIESDVPVPVQIDGDPAGFTPVDVQVLQGALEVFVPSLSSTA